MFYPNGRPLGKCKAHTERQVLGQYQGRFGGQDTRKWMRSLRRIAFDTRRKAQAMGFQSRDLAEDVRKAGEWGTEEGKAAVVAKVELWSAHIG